MSAQAGEEWVRRRLKESRLHYPQGLNPTRTDHPISFGRDDDCGGFGDSMFEDDVHDLPSLVPCEESLDSREERLYQLFTEPNDWEGDEDWHDDPEEMNLPDVAETRPEIQEADSNRHKDAADKQSKAWDTLVNLAIERCDVIAPQTCQFCGSPFQRSLLVVSLHRTLLQEFSLIGRMRL
jgi:hypothetical protein